MLHFYYNNVASTGKVIVQKKRETILSLTNQLKPIRTIETLNF